MKTSIKFAPTQSMKYLTILIFLSVSLFSKAQVKEINPSIGWNYVKSEELEMTDGMWYNTEFAAEKGYDYIFIMNHKVDGAMASIQVFNLQDEFIFSKNKDTSDQIIDLPFDVPTSGVYKVFFGLNDKQPGILVHNVQFMLVRRKKV